ncbi:Glyoxylase, beta-lactamase superfamily II [Pasteurella testudinis DSM 23072]|uniref:Glyoxylase, beta-lactamase superfamily II n=1 Tax=Pasteurella testudinis DSM 23072 TaxID=1122938 RepID=A0A1W1V725_9PAST|nr:MBL fold metallo-hydrolase [Pasteurella testudinis]SMB89095.1 Glyoxylase, beta-lactamase superfamily II [Pasteurella testudinis DSM 23072]SUB50204.1 Arsenate reductase and related proteins, glutaredoxin family [Pasteurella testudinis]
MKKFALGLVAATALSAPAFADNLKMELFNPQAASIMPVSSVIVEGDNEVLLVDAQFQRNDALTLVEKIKATGKPLKTIFISHSDPDFYFGLDVLTQAFPEAEVLATPETAKYVRSKIVAKSDYWSPILKENAPRALVLPKATTADHLKVGTSTIEIKNLDNDPKHTYLWEPVSKTVLGGVVVFDNLHVWMADTKTLAERQTWVRTLENMQKLQPKTVLAGHSLGNNYSPSSVEFTKAYLQNFAKAERNSKNSAELIEKMKAQYPNVGSVGTLELGAKVIKGEMQW